MGSDEKHGSSNSENSSDDQETSRRSYDSADKDGLGRSYVCSFCKRGFTNAQALGGHMNIHRKHKLLPKAKAKKHHHDAASPNKHHHSSESFFNHPAAAASSSSFGLIIHTAAAGLSDHDHHQLSNPSTSNFHWNLAAAEDNLNLRIGGTSSDEIIRNPNTNNLGFTKDWRYDQNDIDLELRLGQYHP